MKKKWYTLISFLLICVLFCAGCKKADKKDEKETNQVVEETGSKEKVEDRTSLNVGFDANFPPYGYMDENGEYVGFDLSLAEEVCKRNDWELIKTPIDWDSKDMELSSGAIDCIWNGFTMTEERQDQYTWSEPYVDNSQVFVVSQDSGIASQADLAGKVVAVQVDSSALAALNSEESADLKASFSSVIEEPDYNTAFMELEAGAVDAVAMDIGVAKYQIESRGDGYIILDDCLASEVYAIGFLLGNTDLRDQVQETLYAMADDKTFATIAEEWGLTDCVCLGK